MFIRLIRNRASFEEAIISTNEDYAKWSSSPEGKAFFENYLRRFAKSRTGVQSDFSEDLFLKGREALEKMNLHQGELLRENFM